VLKEPGGICAVRRQTERSKGVPRGLVSRGGGRGVFIREIVVVDVIFVVVEEVVLVALVALVVVLVMVDILVLGFNSC
jgi:hypothetical protein